MEHLAAHVEPDGGAGGAVPLEAGDLVLAVICNQRISNNLLECDNDQM